LFIKNLQKYKMKQKHIELLQMLSGTFQIPIKYIETITFGNRFNTKLKEYENVCTIELTNHTHAFHTLNKFKSFENYKIHIMYLGEFTELKPGKSFLCKRTAEELEIIERKKNPCLGCTLEKCDINNCIAIWNLTH